MPYDIIAIRLVSVAKYSWEYLYCLWWKALFFHVSDFYVYEVGKRLFSKYHNICISINNHKLACQKLKSKIQLRKNFYHLCFRTCSWSHWKVWFWRLIRIKFIFSSSAMKTKDHHIQVIFLIQNFILRLMGLKFSQVLFRYFEAIFTFEIYFCQKFHCWKVCWLWRLVWIKLNFCWDN